jgi:uncharacterized damage-inducible protein DinB
MVDIQALLEYNRQVRHRYLDAMSRIPWKELVKNRETSFHSIRNIFVHTLRVIDHWLDFLLKEHTLKIKNYEDYENFDAVREYADQVESRLQFYLDSLSSNKLNMSYSLINDLDEKTEVTVEDVLIHLFEEEVHHRGELIALFWQMNIKPPLMGWKYL